MVYVWTHFEVNQIKNEEFWVNTNTTSQLLFYVLIDDTRIVQEVGWDKHKTETTRGGMMCE